MSLLSELASHDGIALSSLIKKKEITLFEVIEATLQRIEELNPTLNAVVTKSYEQALEEAKSISLETPY